MILMSKSLVIFGRQPALGLAEVEALYGPEAIQSVYGDIAVLDIPADTIDFKRLGGVIKLATHIGSVDSLEWENIDSYLSEHIEDFIQNVPEGKLTLGISTFGLSTNPMRINATGLSLKKQLRQSGRSCRVIPNKSSSLNSAQVLYNKLTAERGWELVLVKAGSSVLIGRTVAEQDIDAYAARDQARPMRDAKVGMLPPKLAQTLVNLAVADSTPKYGAVVLDPFCGTGVVLQEATLMGFDIYGTDSDDRMVDYARENMRWLTRQTWSPVQPQSTDDTIGPIQVGDATNFSWKPLPNFIACETYLGRPFSSLPDRATLQSVIQNVDTIHRKFLKNVASQTQRGFRLCIAVPAWRISKSFKHLPVLDNLADMGYTRVVFKHVELGDLIYHREGQVVARELVVLTRK